MNSTETKTELPIQAKLAQFCGWSDIIETDVDPNSYWGKSPTSGPFRIPLPEIPELLNTLRTRLEAVEKELANVKRSDLEFRRGYYLATANIMRTHDQSVIAEDVLRGFGQVDFSGIDTIDVKILKPIALEITRKATAEALKGEG